MSKALAAIDRLIVFLIALASLFFGLWGVLYWAEERTSLNPRIGHILAYNVNQRIWLESPKESWFTVILAALLIIPLVVGIWLFIANVRPNKVRRVTSESASTKDGAIRFNVADIAEAIADELEEIPAVDRVGRRMALDRGTATMEFTVHAEADVNIVALRSHLDQAERDIREAIGDVDIATVYRIHLNTNDNTLEEAGVK